MDIVIHGTKGGRSVFTPRKLAGLLDVTADSAKSAAIGQSAYAIRFTAEAAILSKYHIIRDVRGDKRTGFVGFSLFLPANESLSGSDVIDLLDKVSDEYRRRYITDNNLDEVRENWDFINDILSGYKLKSKYDEVIPSGLIDDAYIYYKDTAELKRYFDAPFQEEYGGYRQVLFVKEELSQRPENPLNALRHSGNDLTKRVDFDNKYYYLHNFDPFKGVTIMANGRIRSQEKDNHVIRANWLVTIKYSLDERCYLPIEAKGTLSNPASDIYKYLEIRDNLVFINYDAFSRPTPKEKTVIFEIKDRQGNPVDNTEIKVGVQQWNMVSGYRCQMTFRGKDLIYPWTVSVRKGDTKFLQDKPFSVEGDLSPISLVLHDRKIVKFHVLDEEGIVYDYKIQVRDEAGMTIGNNNEFVDFYDDQISKTWKITISHPKYESQTFAYCPEKDENPKTVKLKYNHFGYVNSDRQGKRYRLRIDEKYGKRSFKGKEIKDFTTEIPDYGVDARMGYEFIEWSSQNTTHYDGVFEAIFRERWWHKNFKYICIAGVIVLIGLVAAGVFYLKFYLQDATIIPADTEQTDRKTEGDEEINSTDTIVIVPDTPTNPEPANPENSLKIVTDENVKEKDASPSNPVVSPTENNDTEFDQFLKSYLMESEIKKDSLESYKAKTKDRNLKKSIDLALKFWTLDGKKNNDYSWYQKELVNDKNLNISDLMNFVETIYTSNDVKYVNALPKSDQEKSLTHIKDKLK